MIITQYYDNKISINVYGEFTLTDFQEFKTLVNEKVLTEKSLDLLVDLRKMLTSTLDTTIENFAFTREHANDFRKIAIITDSQWITWKAWLSQIFMRAELRVFDDDDDALAWLDIDK